MNKTSIKKKKFKPVTPIFNMITNKLEEALFKTIYIKILLNKQYYNLYESNIHAFPPLSFRFISFFPLEQFFN